jgi:hypothetical protein
MLDCRDLDIEWVKCECEDTSINLSYTIDGKTSYGSCLQIKIASSAGMSFQVNFLIFTQISTNEGSIFCV